ncbi:hypothetical protein A2U01_0001637 [Trifolium medium]|uniref:Uncharacterized protein n=1 Tax=Trifolium medium TaxID=97028 RepID=A0A392M0M2_9FABA|nr:hypothetical protein [Trifolium medium]
MFKKTWRETHSNKQITALVHELFTMLSMVVPHKYSKQSCGTTEQVSTREYSNMEFSYDSGQSSRGESSHRRGSIPKPPIASSDPNHPNRIFNKKLWECMKIAEVPEARQRYLMLEMTVEEKVLLADTPRKQDARTSKKKVMVMATVTVNGLLY